MVTTRAASRQSPVAANTTRRRSSSFLDKWDNRGKDGDVITVKNDGRLRSVSHLVNDDNVAGWAEDDIGRLRPGHKNGRKHKRSFYDTYGRNEEVYSDDWRLDEPWWYMQLQYYLEETWSTLLRIWTYEKLPPFFVSVSLCFTIGSF